MEARTEDERLARRPTLASSWDAAGGALDQRLRVSAAGLGGRDLDWDELLAPPAPGQDLAVLKRSPGSRGEAPCCLHLACDPDGGARVGAVGVLSSARNMEVYVGAEYCGTGRGSSVGTVLDRREQENIILYKKYLKLESSAHACKVKLLSFGEKQCVFVSQVVVHVQPVSANSSASSPALGSRVDLERVQTMVESMGSPLSPGAQQLMRMVRFQQQNGVPIGEQLQSVLGNAAQRMVGLQSSSPLGAFDGSSPSPSPCRTALPAGRLVEGLAAGTDGRSRPPGEALRTALGQCEPLPQERALPQRAGEHAVSALVPEPAGGRSGPPQADVLSLLQSLCGQASRLRVEPHREWPAPGPKPRDGLVDAAMGEQPVCSYLEKILSKSMERLEKKLTDYIDQRIYRLQEHFDNKIALLMDLLQSPSSPPHGLPLRHYGSGETLSNGERSTQKVGGTPLGADGAVLCRALGVPCGALRPCFGGGRCVTMRWPFAGTQCADIVTIVCVLMGGVSASRSVCKMFDVSVMTAVGVALLVAILMLMSCASTLLCKLTDLLKAPTSPVCLVLKNPSMVARDTITASTYATSGCYPKVQNCEECDLCADSENLPPCFCDVNEGL